MKVGLFIPCYINALYPQVARASYELLVRLGCDVEYPLDQTSRWPTPGSSRMPNRWLNG